MTGNGLLALPLYGGSVRDWLVALGLCALIVLGVEVVKSVVARRLAVLAQRTQTQLDDALVAAMGATRLWLVALLGVALGIQYLALPAAVERALDGAASLALFVQLGLWISALVAFLLDRARERAVKTDAGAATGLYALGFVGKLLIWTLVGLLALDNLGVNVTALVAGLGVGGIAVALAVQNILGDLFASLSIVIDKPFVIGDFVVVDEFMGTVEHVGLKTTRIRSLGGEQIVFSNSDLLKTRLRNYKRMYERRVVFKFGLLYETPLDKLERIPGIVRRIVEAQARVRFDRAHFARLGESSLDFEVVYWVLDADYNLHMDILQAINLALMRELAREEVGFAYPTRTLHVAEPRRVEGALTPR